MKKGKILFIFLFFIFCIPSIVFADTKNPTCADIRNKLNEYNGVVDEYNSLVCDLAEDAVTYQNCRTLVLKKYSIMQDLYNYNAKNDSCNITELNAVLSENENHCTNSFSSMLKEYSSNILNAFYIIAPFLLILFGSIDFFKMIVNTDPKSIQKNRSNFIRRIIALLLLYFTPYITNLILTFTVYDLSDDNYICTAETSNLTAGTAGTTNTFTGSSPTIISGVYGYDNSIATYDPGTNSNFLKAADAISKSWASQKYNYSVNQLVSNDIKGSINSQYKTTCCATLVAAALYQSNLISESEINGIPYNGALYIAELLDRKGWQIIDDYNYIKEGDIVFMTSSANATAHLSNGKTYLEGHVQIYAGGNNWYNAGSTEAIQGSQPSYQSDSYVRSRFSFAMRPTKSYK